jgi:hypothetical protein
MKIKKKATTIILPINKTNAQFNGKAKDQPPKNNKVTKTDKTIILPYSPKKNKAKVNEEYSTLYPATSSASASGKSNGVRLVSANMEIKKAIAKGNNANINQLF